MNERLGEVLEQYEQRLKTLHRAASQAPAVEHVLFSGFDDWERQLVFKLAPRLSGDGCLIVAVAGGTNTGKSTVFNSLLNATVSPVAPYGAYTKHPVIAASPSRSEQVLEPGKLLPDAFAPIVLDTARAGAVADPRQAGMAIFVATCDALPDRIVLLDTPDIDSVVKENWELAKSIREAGDVLIAVLTGQKYADSIVVEFFREALRSGRLVIPLMNMADDGASGHEVTRHQLGDFLNFVHDEEDGATSFAPSFVMSRLPEGERASPPQPCALDENTLTLMDYLESLDAVGLKKKILGDSLSSFAGRGDDFLQRADIFATVLGQCIAELRTMAHQAAAEYDARPGREFLTVVYEFIQKHARGPDRVLSAVTAKVVRLPGWVFSKTRALFPRKAQAAMSEQDMDKQQRVKLEEILNRLYGAYVQRGEAYLRQYCPEAAPCFTEALRKLDPGDLATIIASQTLRTEVYMEAYREYAYKDLEARWADRSFRWKVRLFYDLGLLGSWAGVLVLLWAKGWAPHLPLSEILASFGVPVIQHTVTHGALYLWGDKLSGLIDQWQHLQRDALERAIIEHLTVPALGALTSIDEALTENIATMKELNDLCRKTV